jgi:hypothetical protein
MEFHKIDRVTTCPNLGPLGSYTPVRKLIEKVLTCLDSSD